MPTLPESRGPLTERLLSALTEPVHALDDVTLPSRVDGLADDDLHLALYLCYELHYRGLPGVDERWEWEPTLLALRRDLESVFEAALLGALGEPEGATTAPEEMDLALRAVGEADDGPSLSTYLERDGTAEQLLEFIVHRSAYQLKEADPHAFLIPRLSGPPKAALVEIEADEFGGGKPDRVHATLFANTMRALGLDDTYGAFVDQVPGVTLATVNLISLFGLHRRWRGACAGHLALFEMTSSVPARRYGNALRRHGYGQDATDFFDEHVEADAVHEAIAGADLAGGLVRQEPALAGQILWGARALTFVEGRWARALMDAWAAGHTSLRAELGAHAKV